MTAVAAELQEQVDYLNDERVRLLKKLRDGAASGATAPSGDGGGLGERSGGDVSGGSGGGRKRMYLCQLFFFKICKEWSTAVPGAKRAK